MPIGEACNAIAFGLFDWKGLPSCRVSFCVTKLVQLYYREDIPSQRNFPDSLFGITKVIELKHSKFLTGRCYEGIYIFKNYFSLITLLPSQKIISCFPLNKAQQQWQKIVNYLWIISPRLLFAVSSDKSLWVQGSVSILPIFHCLCFTTLLLGSVEILPQSPVHRTVYLTLKFPYQLHHPAVAVRPKLFSISVSWMGPGLQRTQAWKHFKLGSLRWKCSR